MPKTYSYQFSYYWKIAWADEASFKSDTANYKGFKQRIKRECKVTLFDSVLLYLNLRWVTTYGRMKSLFPNAKSIEVSSPEEFSTMKDPRDIKPVVNRKTYKLRRVLDPTEKYSYSLREVPLGQNVENGINEKRKAGSKLDLSQSKGDEHFQNNEVGNISEFEVLRKKIHNELEDKSTISTEYSVYSPKKVPEDQFMHSRQECESYPIYKQPQIGADRDIDFARIDEELFEKHNEEELQFFLGSSEGTNKVKNEELNPEIYIPKSIRNFGIEDSIDPFYLEDDQQQYNPNYDLL